MYAGPRNAAKRRRIPVPPIGFGFKPRPRAGKERAREDIFFSKATSFGAFPFLLPLPDITVSEPPEHMSWGSIESVLSPGFSSQPAKTPNKTDNSWLQADFSSLFVPGGKRAEKFKAKGDVMDSTSPVLIKSDPDYDSWERGVSPQKLMEVWDEQEGKLVPQFEGKQDYVDEEVLMGMSVNEGGGGDEDDENASGTCLCVPFIATVDQQLYFTDEDLLSSSLGEYPLPLRLRRRDRSQTAPEPDIEGPLGHDTPVGQPLRQHRTSPGLDAVDSINAGASGGGVSVARMPPSIAALQQVYARFAEAGISGALSGADADSMDIDEIILARKLANQINQALDEKIASKIASRVKKGEAKPEG